MNKNCMELKGTNVNLHYSYIYIYVHTYTHDIHCLEHVMSVISFDRVLENFRIILSIIVVLLSNS